MSLEIINGLPAHVLFVHAVIVLVPLTALVLVVAALLPRAARRIGVALPVLALVTLGFVPLSTHAGEWLERHVDSDPLVRRHAELGDGMLPWAAGLVVLAAAVWWTTRRYAAGTAAAPAAGDAAARPRTAPVALRAVVAVLCLAVGAGAVVDVYRIGDSGAKAAWHDGFSQKAAKGGEDGEG
ncbi:hypothetical protein LO771_16935 [Streptacidiphilus sp. ASG 303]|uniref:DUF2231 domain-containing protein n=1 Tax=Streptacidiphilus sp. ASG 303 TaxID=2896847 RepID=UPI001E4ED353|nr:DUF2231 domain-containing protein [Streptacidiphilus sp. ASG 303]MCD0484031.1 hypothetical protein [Streptacidiphilus sp. ASG 303]